MNAEAISREDYLNAPGEEFTVKLDTGERTMMCRLKFGWLSVPVCLLARSSGGGHA